MHSWRWEVLWKKGLNAQEDSWRYQEALGEARQVAGGGLQVSRRGGSTQMGPELPHALGGGSAGMGWAGLMSFGRRRQSWAVSSAPAGPTPIQILPQEGDTFNYILTGNYEDGFEISQ